MNQRDIEELKQYEAKKKAKQDLRMIEKKRLRAQKDLEKQQKKAISNIKDAREQFKQAVQEAKAHFAAYEKKRDLEKLNLAN